MATGEASEQPQPTNRIRNFALFFKNYMSVSSIVVASLPIPATALNLIPVYDSQRELLSVYASLFCFLVLGFIFFVRHTLARYFFPDIAYADLVHPPKLRSLFSAYLQLLPLALIALSVLSAFEYQSVYRSSLIVAQAERAAALQGGQLANAYLQEMRRAPTRAEQLSLAQEFISQAELLTAADSTTSDIGAQAISIAKVHAPSPNSTPASANQPTLVQLVSRNFLTMPESASGSEAHNSDIRNFIGKPQPSELLSSALKSTDAQQVPYDTSLMMYYLGMFVFAEAAFTLMAMKEYLQDLLHISERALIIVGYDPGAEKNEQAARIPGDASNSNWSPSEKAAE